MFSALGFSGQTPSLWQVAGHQDGPYIREQWFSSFGGNAFTSVQFQQMLSRRLSLPLKRAGQGTVERGPKRRPKTIEQRDKREFFRGESELF